MEEFVTQASSRLLTFSPELSVSWRIMANRDCIRDRELGIQASIAVVPVLLGSGRRLFGVLEADIPLTHGAARVYDFGLVQLECRVIRAASAR